MKISGAWNDWNGPEMDAIVGANNAYQTTVDLKSLAEDQEFKLVVNGEWIGSGELTLDANGFVTEGETGSNLWLKAGKAYDIVAFWRQPGLNVKEGWYLNVVENTTTAISAYSAQTRSNETVFNMKGQRLSQQQRGVNIVNGKKVVRK